MVLSCHRLHWALIKYATYTYFFLQRVIAAVSDRYTTRHFVCTDWQKNLQNDTAPNIERVLVRCLYAVFYMNAQTRHCYALLPVSNDRLIAGLHTQQSNVISWNKQSRFVIASYTRFHDLNDHATKAKIHGMHDTIITKILHFVFQILPYAKKKSTMTYATQHLICCYENMLRITC